jgi:hypothetical protein
MLLSNTQPPIVKSRDLNINDLPWGLSLAWERYAPFDPGAASQFYINVLKSQATFKVRTDHAFLIAMITTIPWKPTEKECNILILCAEEGYHWEAVHLMRRSISWSEENGCARWWFASDTEHKVDALCRRVGAMTAHPRYFIPGV